MSPSNLKKTSVDIWQGNPTNILAPSHFWFWKQPLILIFSIVPELFSHKNVVHLHLFSNYSWTLLKSQLAIFYISRVDLFSLCEAKRRNIIFQAVRPIERGLLGRASGEKILTFLALKKPGKEIKIYAATKLQACWIVEALGIWSALSQMLQYTSCQ